MRIFIAGATGAIGQALVPQLVARGSRARSVDVTNADAAPLPSGGSGSATLARWLNYRLRRCTRLRRPFGQSSVMTTNVYG